MSCDQAPERAEQYVTGQLTGAERDAYEAHFFECGPCLERVQDFQVLQQVLAESSGSAAPRVFGMRRPMAAWLAAAAAVVMVLGIWQVRRNDGPAPAMVAAPAGASVSPDTSPRRSPAAEPSRASREATLARLSAVEAPRYVALPVRSDEAADAKQFDAAMAEYVAGDYAAAARALAPLARPPHALPHAAFFLGVSELMSGDLDGARTALGRASASGVAPYADESHFYLAKIALRTGDVEAARRELAVAAAHDAGPPGEAQRILDSLRTIDE